MHRPHVHALLLALTASLSACSPNPPTDGFYGCATGACPPSFPYCDPATDRCYASEPADTGPRPDAPGVDAPIVSMAREYETCGTGCPSPLSCIGGSCMTPCSGPMCADGRSCRPVSMMDMTNACVVSCSGGVTCPARTRMRVVMGSECQCVPSTWP